MEIEKFVTITELAEMLNCCTRTVSRMVDEGRIPQPYRLNRRTLRWRLSEVLRRIEELAGTDPSQDA